MGERRLATRLDWGPTRDPVGVVFGTRYLLFLRADVWDLMYGIECMGTNVWLLFFKNPAGWHIGAGELGSCTLLKPPILLGVSY